MKNLTSVNLFKYLGLFLISFPALSQQTIASFNAPATVCVNQPINIANTTTGQINSSYWSFCLGNQNTTPVASNLGNIGGQLSMPVYYSIAKDGTDYYAFVSNNAAGTITRLFYGSSLLNVPTAVNLGNLGALGPNLEDIHLELQGNTWYGLAVGGIGGAIYSFTFGTTLANTPTVVNMGNIGSLGYPQRLQVFWSGGNCYAFTPNAFSNTITRFSFGNNIGSIPTGFNFGNIGSLSHPDDIAIINFNGNWHAYVVNEVSNTITRLDFGSSLLNTPAAINLGNTGALDGPRGIDVYVECGEVKGLIVNRYGNDLLKMSFPSGPTGPLTTTSYGNIGNFSFPHSIERFRVGDTLFAMIPNVNNNSLTRIYYPGCSNSSIGSSTLQTPPTISYNQTGTYYVSYIANEGQISQSSYCQPIVVTGITAGISGTPKVCAGDTIKLYGSGVSPYSWAGPSNFTSTLQNVVIPTSSLSNGGTYTLQVGASTGCAGVAMYSVSTVASPTLSVPNQTICYGSTATLTASGAFSYLWSTSHTTNSIKVAPGITTVYSVKGFNENCATTRTVEVSVIICTGIAENGSSFIIEFYPNPVSNELNIRSEKSLTLSLVNSIGQNLKTISVKASTPATFDLSDLPAGIYFLTGTNQRSSINERIIISR